MDEVPPRFQRQLARNKVRVAEGMAAYLEPGEQVLVASLSTFGRSRAIALTDRRIILGTQAFSFRLGRIKRIVKIWPRGVPITTLGRFGVNRTLRIDGEAVMVTGKWDCAELIRSNGRGM
jgi:hypothetical protein